MVVADDTAVFGTVNLDAWALYRNFEIAMMARCAATAKLFEERVFTPDIAHSIAGTTPKGVAERPQGLVVAPAGVFPLIRTTAA